MANYELTTSSNGLYIVENISRPADWMEGDILGTVFEDDTHRVEVALAVADGIETVEPGQAAYKTCTDARYRIGLADGESTVPVRGQLVGSSAISGFRAAAALGSDFFPDKIDTLDERIRYVFDAMRDGGQIASTHLNCGAAGNFVTVMNNELRFAANDNFVAGLRDIMPEDMYDPKIHDKVLAGLKECMGRNAYAGYSDEMILRAVLARPGEDGQAVEKYLDDGRGVHGHREQARVRLADSLGGVALSPNVLADTHDFQVFGVNGSSVDTVAKIFSNDGDIEEYYLTARLAIESFTAAGHGTLGRNLETWLVRPAG